MSEAINGNGERIQKAAENAFLTLASRWIAVRLEPPSMARGCHVI